MGVVVTPSSFANVAFDAQEIEQLTATLARQIGLDADIEVDVDESTPLARVRLVSLDPVRLEAESGALEDNRRPRQFGEVQAADALGRALVKAADRLDPAFGAPPLDEQVPLPHLVAWDTTAAGRLARLGYRPQRQRRLYTFELRHGFTDAAIAAFDALWTADSLSFAEIVALSDETRSVAEMA